MEELKKVIREIPDFPKKGILFYDITTLLKDAKAFRKAVDALGDRYSSDPPDCVVTIDARGFIFGAALAYRLGTGLAIVRKAGKLPYETYKASYALEYGSDEIEMHVDAVDKGQRVLIVDDLLATGGTASATVDLVRAAEGRVIECCFVVELLFLGGRARLAEKGVQTFSLVQYD